MVIEKFMKDHLNQLMFAGIRLKSRKIEGIMMKYIAVIFLTVSLCGAAQANDMASEKVGHIVNRAIDGNDRMANTCADNWLCKVMIDSTKGVEIKNLTFNGRSACGVVSGISVSGRNAVNDFVIPDYDGDSIYLKFEEVDGHASPALEAYEAAKRKYCKN